VGGGHARADDGEIAVEIDDAAAGGHPGDDAQPVTVASLRVQAGGGEAQRQVGVVAGLEAEARRQDADDAEALVVDEDVPSDDARIGGETAVPQLVREDDDVVLPGASSPGAKKRPARGATPRTRKKSGVTTPTSTRSRPSPPARVTSPPE
jgi:hypothetical protein